MRNKIKWKKLDDAYESIIKQVTEEDRQRYNEIFSNMAFGFREFADEWKNAEEGDDDIEYAFFKFGTTMAFIENELIKKSESGDALMAVLYLLDTIIETVTGGMVAFNISNDTVNYFVRTKDDE